MVLKHQCLLLNDKYTTLNLCICFVNGHPKERVFNSYHVIDFNITILRILVSRESEILKVSESFRGLVKSESPIFRFKNLQH